VDYKSQKALIEAQKIFAGEIGLGKTRGFERKIICGREALALESKRAGAALVGLEIDWNEGRTLYEALGDGAAGASMASRVVLSWAGGVGGGGTVPVYRAGKQGGRDFYYVVTTF